MNFSFTPKFVCTHCGSQADPIGKQKGSGFMELLLYLFFVSIPIALVYSIWRRTGREKVCPKCKQPTLVPISSPAGQKLIEKAK